MNSVLSAPSDLHSVDVDHLKCGTQLRFPIYDEHNVLLLAKGQTIESSFKGRLLQRGISKVKIHETEMTRVLAGKPQGCATIAPEAHAGVICPEANSATVSLDRLLDAEQNLGLPPQGDAFLKEVRQPGASHYDACLETEIIDNHLKSVDQIDSLFQTIAENQPLDVEQVSVVSDSALDYLREDPDLYACLGINPLSGTYPARHSVHTQMLAVSIGMNLGLDRTTLKELAIGCLIHDSGMLQINPELYNRAKPLSDVEFLEITKHPIRTFDMLRDNKAVPYRSAFIAYQMHERCNGEGYPRGRKGNQIHFLAKVAGVADAFTALVTPRPHREGMLPYKAMESMILGVKKGLFDAEAVRALLGTTSLFPLGSYVELTDGRMGRVIRANGKDFARPVVEAWSPHQLDGPGQIVDLSQESTINVKRAIARLTS